jgi:hypothetical protein
MRSLKFIVLICYVISSPVGLIAQCSRDSIPFKSIWVNARPAYEVQAGLMCNYIRQNTFIPASSIGYSAGIGTRKNISENLFISLRVSYQHKSFSGLNTIVYEPLVRGNLQLTTSASFDEIESSILICTSFPHFETGAGLAPSYLIHSILNQTVSNAPPSQAYQMSTIYNKNNNPYTAYFYLTNVSPCLYIAYPFTKHLSIAYYFSFELVKNPIEPYSFIQPYQFIQNKITLILKFRPHEKNALP